MFEAAETPEKKLFNVRIGQSTGKSIWTYVSSHTEYNCEHLKGKSMRGWYTSLVDGDRWQDILNDLSVRGLKSFFDFAQKNKDPLRSVMPQPQVGILTGSANHGMV
jgi:hypothetical protein